MSAGKTISFAKAAARDVLEELGVTTGGIYTPGGGGSDTLADVLGRGAETDGEDLTITDGDSLLFGTTAAIAEDAWSYTWGGAWASTGILFSGPGGADLMQVGLADDLSEVQLELPAGAWITARDSADLHGSHNIACAIGLGGNGTILVDATEIQFREASAVGHASVTERMRIDNATISVGPYPINFGSAVDTVSVGLKYVASGVLAVTDGSTGYGKVRFAQGSVAGPGIANSTGVTGFALTASSAVVSVGGNQIHAWGSGQSWAENGSAGAPAYSFWNDSGTGVYSPTASQLGLSTNGKAVRFVVVDATPEGSVSAPVGSICSDKTNGVLYFKVTGSGNTGWKSVTLDP